MIVCESVRKIVFCFCFCMWMWVCDCIICASASASVCVCLWLVLLVGCLNKLSWLYVLCHTLPYFFFFSSNFFIFSLLVGVFIPHLQMFCHLRFSFFPIPFANFSVNLAIYKALRIYPLFPCTWFKNLSIIYKLYIFSDLFFFFSFYN